MSKLETMPASTQTTVLRLDKPSAYYLGRVGTSFSFIVAFARLIHILVCQNKKRKFGRDRDDDDVGRQRTPEEPEDPLKDAATLYVGNLYAEAPCPYCSEEVAWLMHTGHSILRRSRYMNCLPSKIYENVCWKYFVDI